MDHALWSVCKIIWDLWERGCSRKSWYSFCHVLILMGEPDLTVLVEEVQVFTAHTCKFFAVTDRLSAAADTAAGAGHDFYEVIRYIAAPDRLEEFSCVAEATDNGGATVVPLKSRFASVSA